MFIQNSTQRYAADQNKYPLSDAARRAFEQEALIMNRWVCGNCGTTHGRILPEECKSCGATALEFQYSSPADGPRA